MRSSAFAGLSSSTSRSATRSDRVVVRKRRTSSARSSAWPCGVLVSGKERLAATEVAVERQRAEGRSRGSLERFRRNKQERIGGRHGGQYAGALRARETRHRIRPVARL